MGGEAGGERERERDARSVSCGFWSPNAHQLSGSVVLCSGSKSVYSCSVPCAIMQIASHEQEVSDFRNGEVRQEQYIVTTLRVSMTITCRKSATENKHFYSSLLLFTEHRRDRRRWCCMSTINLHGASYHTPFCDTPSTTNP